MCLVVFSIFFGVVSNNCKCTFSIPSLSFTISHFACVPFFSVIIIYVCDCMTSLLCWLALAFENTAAKVLLCFVQNSQRRWKRCFFVFSRYIVLPYVIYIILFALALCFLPPAAAVQHLSISRIFSFSNHFFLVSVSFAVIQLKTITHFYY